MNNILICKSCLYTSAHPLKITFNEESVCSGCIIHEEKNTLNWNDRFLKLQKIVKETRCGKTEDDDE